MNLQRLEMQFGSKNLAKLKNAHIAVFGLGGVGGMCAETLARSGVGELSIVDKDIFEPSNINRQIFALNSTMGRAKVDVCKERLKDINKDITIYKYNVNFAHDECDLDFSEFDYVVDAIDDTDAKLLIIESAQKQNCPIISCMGMGNKVDPMKLQVSYIENSHTCPLAKKMRKMLKERNIEGVKCLFSTEQSIPTQCDTISSNAFVPAVAGIMLARTAIFDIIDYE